MRILSRLAFAAATLAGAALLVPAIVLAADSEPVSPMSFGELLVACTASGGEPGASGHFYWCTKDDCDGEGGTCTIGCSDEGGIETCEGSTPSRVSLRDQRKFLRALGTRFLTASVGAGDTGTPNRPTLPTAPAAPAGATVVIY